MSELANIAYMANPIQKTRVLGLMSGTSLDGLDLALCMFWKEKNKWQFEVEKAETFSYSESEYNGLKLMETLSGNELIKQHVAYGKYIGQACVDFIPNNKAPSLIASHGHTIFHNPQKGYTFQAGCGQSIASTTGIPCVSNFRQKDICQGGEGAPLAPFGDIHLFSGFDAYLNLGGFANITLLQLNEKIVAYDICPANYVLNALASQLHLNYDPAGENARKGSVNLDLLNALNQLNYYRKIPPKSLGREWVEKMIFPHLELSGISTLDLLRTFVEHAAIQISKALFHSGKVLATGGGVHNQFLMERISELYSGKIYKPDSQIIDFKEAVLFAFLGLKRWRLETNVLCEATGASHDVCAGDLYLP